MPNSEVLDTMKQIFKSLNIVALNDIQLAAISVMEQQQKVFQVFGTGTGKTTLALAFMLKLAKIDGIKCFYVIDIPELCSRDFKRIVGIAQDMNIRVVLAQNDDEAQSINDNNIIFLSSLLFQKVAKC